MLVTIGTIAIHPIDIKLNIHMKVDLAGIDLCKSVTYDLILMIIVNYSCCSLGPTEWKLSIDMQKKKKNAQATPKDLENRSAMRTRCILFVKTVYFQESGDELSIHQHCKWNTVGELRAVLSDFEFSELRGGTCVDCRVQLGYRDKIIVRA